MPMLQHIDAYLNEDDTITLYARDRNGVPVNLSGSTIAWYVGHPPRAPDSTFSVFNKTGVISNAALGIFQVTFGPGDTQFLAPGDYLHQAWQTDTGGLNHVVTRGRLRLRDYIGLL